MEIKFGNHTIGLNHPTYFIADIAANHDGDLGCGLKHEGAFQNTHLSRIGR